MSDIIPDAHRLATTDQNGQVIVRSPKRLKPTEPSKKLQSRRDDFDSFIKTVDTKWRNGYHRPGSMNRNK